MSNAQLCALITAGRNVTDELAQGDFEYQPMSALTRVTYAWLAPLIIAVGVVGDVLTVVTLTHPLLRRASIIYTYLTLLALTDLLTQLSVVPMILWLMDVQVCARPAALFYAHVGFPLANALMGSSVWIVVFLTLSQYMAVCRPLHYGSMRSRKLCLALFALAYAFNFSIYAPWATKKQIHHIPGLLDWDLCPYVVCDAPRAQWFIVYEWIREVASRVFPFFLVAFLNARILMTYRSTKKTRMQRLTSNSQQKGTGAKSEREEKRLFALLFGIIIIFFVCTIPAAPLTILVADAKSNNYPFQIFRNIVNLMEFTKFALNFYFYCLINPDIRRICLHVVTCRELGRPARVKGQPVNPISLYTRSTKQSTMRTVNNNNNNVAAANSRPHIGKGGRAGNNRNHWRDNANNMSDDSTATTDQQDDKARRRWSMHDSTVALEGQKDGGGDGGGGSGGGGAGTTARTTAALATAGAKRGVAKMHAPPVRRHTAAQVEALLIDGLAVIREKDLVIPEQQSNCKVDEAAPPPERIPDGGGGGGSGDEQRVSIV